MGTRFSLSPQARAMLARVGTTLLVSVTVAFALLVGAELTQQAQNWSTLHRDRDFPSYYLAAGRLLRGQDFYSGLQDEARALGIADYFIDAAVTPPTFVLTIVPLTLLSYPVAWGVWQVLSLAALVLSLHLIVRQHKLTLSFLGWVRLGCAVLLFPPLTYHLLYAHTELLMLLLLTGGWLFLRRGREIASGLLLGLAGAIRIYPLLLLLYLAQRRAWKALGAALASGVGLAALAALVAGPPSYLRYLGVVREVVPTLYPRWGNFSLWGDVHKVASIWPALGQRPLLRDGLAALLGLGVVGLTLWLTRRPGKSPHALDREFGLFIVAALLASPLSWIYYQVLLYLPLLCLLAQSRQGERPRSLPGILAATAVTAFAHVIGVILELPALLQTTLAFVPTLTLVGVYVALALTPQTEDEGGRTNPQWPAPTGAFCSESGQTPSKGTGADPGGGVERPARGPLVVDGGPGPSSVQETGGGGQVGQTFFGKQGLTKGRDSGIIVSRIDASGASQRWR